MSGPLGELGQAMHQGAKAAFAAINAKGGVHGRAIELTVADDGYDVKRALANVQWLYGGPRQLRALQLHGNTHD